MRPERQRVRRCRGGWLSFELLLVLPILAGLLLATLEFSFVLSANHKLKEACRQAARVAARPCNSGLVREELMQETIERVLRSPQLIDAYSFAFEPGRMTGDEVIVQLRLPMAATAPDMLAVFGLSLKGRELNALAVVQKE